MWDKKCRLAQPFRSVWPPEYMSETTIPLVDPHRVLSLFGARDQHLRTIRDTLGVSIVHRDGEIRVAGEDAAVARAASALTQLNSQLDEQRDLSGEHVAAVLAKVTGKRVLSTPPIDVVTAA